MQRLVQVVYVHGFGGQRQDQCGRPLAAFFRQHCRQLHDRFNFVQLVWRSEWRGLRQIPADFKRARDEATPAATELCTLLHQFEDQAVTYHLIGFSLGAEVIRRALHLQGTPLPRLRSIYLLGAAFNHDETIEEAVIPAGARCHNYFSKQCDYVLKFSYRMASRGVPAAGERGLSKSSRFLNLPTRCSHKLIHNYSMLAAPIGFVISWDEGTLIDGRATRRLPRMSAWGFPRWNDIARHKGHVLQQQVRYGWHYRAVREGAQPLIPACGTNLHAILRQL